MRGWEQKHKRKQRSEGQDEITYIIDVPDIFRCTKGYWKLVYFQAICVAVLISLGCVPHAISIPLVSFCRNYTSYKPFSYIITFLHFCKSANMYRKFDIQNSTVGHICLCSLPVLVVFVYQIVASWCLHIMMWGPKWLFIKNCTEMHLLKISKQINFSILRTFFAEVWDPSCRGISHRTKISSFQFLVL